MPAASIAALLAPAMHANQRNSPEYLADICRELAQLRGISAEELAATKTYLTGSYPLRFDGNGPLATIMVNMQLIGLPPDYPKTRNDKVNAVTAEDVQRVAKTLFRPDDLRFIVVGEPDGLDSSD